MTPTAKVPPCSCLLLCCSTCRQWGESVARWGVQLPCQPPHKDLAVWPVSSAPGPPGSFNKEIPEFHPARLYQQVGTSVLRLFENSLACPATRPLGSCSSGALDCESQERKVRTAMSTHWGLLRLSVSPAPAQLHYHKGQWLKAKERWSLTQVAGWWGGPHTAPCHGQTGSLSFAPTNLLWCYSCSNPALHKPLFCKIVFKAVA